MERIYTNLHVAEASIIQTFNQLVRKQKAIGRNRHLRMGIGVGNHFVNLRMQ